MYPAVILSLSCLLLTCVIGVVIWWGIREKQRRRREREEKLKRQIMELTGQDFIRGHTTVEDLERQYGKKG